MRYYHYISAAKLEMLYEQISPEARERFAVDLGINIGIISANFRSEKVENAQHQKIQILERYLGRRVGTLIDPKPYIADTVVAAWGPFEDYENIVYFGGYENGMHFGLMGSFSNCVGAPNALPSGYSLERYIVHTLARRKLLPPRTPTSSCKGTPTAEANEKAFEGVVMANQCSIEPKTKVRFLARTVLARQCQDRHDYGVYIGTPIYVAAED